MYIKFLLAIYVSLIYLSSALAQVEMSKESEDQWLIGKTCNIVVPNKDPLRAYGGLLTEECIIIATKYNFIKTEKYGWVQKKLDI